MSLSANKVRFTILIAALGYFVDIYELLMFSIVRRPSLISLGVSATDFSEMIGASTWVINWQMGGLLLGGVIWGVMGDKRGRLSVLFGSILLYSLASFATGFVQTVNQYAMARFIGGIGLAGELGVGITLVSELMPKLKRGIGTSFVAGTGLLGAVFAYIIFKLTNDWRLCYKIGGLLGIVLLLLRISVSESLLFEQVKKEKVSRGDFFMFFNNGERFRKYLMAILIGLPAWYAIGILMNLSTAFAKELYPDSEVDSGKAVMLGYVGLSIGDITIGFVSQYFKSRKKALALFYGFTIISIILYFSSLNHSDHTMYLLCGFLGFSVGFWAIFVTMGAEQFGTNIRATAATTIPNMVRGALPLMNILFKDLLQDSWHFSIYSSGVITGLVVMLVSSWALFLTRETFHKDMNYLDV